MEDMALDMYNERHGHRKQTADNRRRIESAITQTSFPFISMQVCILRYSGFGLLTEAGATLPRFHARTKRGKKHGNVSSLRNGTSLVWLRAKMPVFGLFEYASNHLCSRNRSFPGLTCNDLRTLQRSMDVHMAEKGLG